jgi:hypothetical protein
MRGSVILLGIPKRILVSESAVRLPGTQRRRSERVSASIPVSISGTDLFGQPFSERTTTLDFNLHGCRYTSRHQLPKNSWVTLERGSEAGSQALRARVVWIQRPHSIRDYFQVAIEMEGPANIWGVESPPEDWRAIKTGGKREGGAVVEINVLGSSDPGRRPLPATLASYIRELVAHVTNESPTGPSAPNFAIELGEISSEEHAARVGETSEREGREGGPLLRGVSAEIERRAKQAVQLAAAEARASLEQWSQSLAERIQKREEDEAAQARKNLEERQEGLAAQEGQVAHSIRGELEEKLTAAREIFSQLEEKARELGREREAAEEASSRLARARFEAEAAEVTARSRQPAETGHAAEEFDEASRGDWRQRLESEMNVAQGQWNELLQSSLDAGVHRLIAQVSARSQEILLESERRISERFSELQNSFLQAAAEARRTLAETKTTLEEEVARAGFSLAEIEHSAARIKEYSAQLEAASHDSLNGLHRRLERILEDQTAEMNRRAEGLAARLLERAGPALESLSQEAFARTMAEIESSLAPHKERASELIHELRTRELQVEDSLRIHRERLRQVSEQGQREATSQINAAVGILRADFEGARKEALAKWTEELDASGARASHAATESMARGSEWFEQETRSRLQVQMEQTLTNSAAALEEKFLHLASRFELQLEEKSADKSREIEERLDRAAGELVVRSRLQIEEAAREAASSFGQVVREVSGQEIEQFSRQSRKAIEERLQDFEQGTLRRQHEFEQGFAQAWEAQQTERMARQQEWIESLESISRAAASRFEEQLETSRDSFVMSSIRRVNEHGQNVIESLLRSAEQTIRDSFSHVFDGLATALRERSAGAASVTGFVPPTRDTPDPPMPRNESSNLSAGA